LKRTLILVFALFCTYVPTEVTAEEVSGLYSGQISVADQTDKSRQSGVRDALAQVLVKLTGNSNIMQVPGIQDAVSNTDNYVAGVGYKSLPAELGELPKTELQVNFSRQAIDRLIREAQLPILPSERPKLLIWIVRDDPLSGRQFVSSQVLPEFTQQLDSLMQQRGMPYSLPDFDLEDQRSLSVNQAWGLQKREIEAASQRYAVDGWALLRFFTTATGEARGTWVYGVSALRGFNDVRAENSELFATTAVNQLVDSLSAQFTYIPQTNASELVVQINQVDSYADYQAVLAQLQKLELVQSLNVFAVKGDRLFLTLNIEGGVDLLESALVRSGRLTNQTSQAARFSGNLEFDWIAK
jgi:uncharacterized protein